MRWPGPKSQKDVPGLAMGGGGGGEALGNLAELGIGVPKVLPEGPLAAVAAGFLKLG